MYLLRLPKHPDIFFYSVRNMESSANFLCILDETAAVFDRYMGEMCGRPLTVRLVSPNENPECVRELSEIRLAASYNYPSQAVYQFAHELCHFRIENPVCGSLRWLEESFCEAGSHFVLRRLAPAVFRESGHKALAEYAPKFTKYSEEILKTAKNVDLTDPDQIRRFMMNCYLREENLCAAENLLKVFSERPDLWRAVCYLGHVPEGFSFYDSLSIWKQHCPAELHSAVDLVFGIFRGDQQINNP